jgi:ABC-type multidrug transport system fused ATPase/permease subunit
LNGIDIEENYNLDTGPKKNTFESDFKRYGNGSKRSKLKLFKSERISTYGKVKRRYVPLTHKSKFIDTPVIEFQNVSAKYITSKKPILQNLNFKIYPTERIGIVGKTGSGKSTLIKLLWKYLNISKGKIMIHGKDLNSYNLKRLRKNFYLISQETALFSASLRKNLDPTTFSFSDDVLNKTMKDLNFLNEAYLTDDLDMQIGDNGQGLSQGEKQVISFARCMLDLSGDYRVKQKVVKEFKEERFYFPPILILDEATSNIDLKTEEIIQSQLFPEEGQSSMIPKSTTMLIIAHRVQTILNCDKIMVLNEGELTAFESPKSLMEKEGGFFKEIVEEMIKE